MNRPKSSTWTKPKTLAGTSISPSRNTRHSITLLAISSSVLWAVQKQTKLYLGHTLAGTGANSLGARFLKEALNPSAVWLSDPTWVNHHNIWSLVVVEIKTYPYWNAEKRGVGF